MNIPMQLHRRSAIALFITLMLGLLCLLIYYWFATRINNRANQSINSAIESLRSDNVVKISASINDLKDSMGLSKPPIDEFNIATEYHSTILKAIIPAKKFAYPSAWDNIAFGYVFITTKTRDRIQVAYCNAGKNPLCYSVDGSKYMRGGTYRPVIIDKADKHYKDEGALLYNIIREIHQEQATGKKNKELTELIDELKRSIGEKPSIQMQDKMGIEPKEG